MVDDYLRARISRLSFEEASKLCEGITELGRELTRVGASIELKTGIPLLEIEPGRYDLQRLLYYKFMKAFWNEGLSFAENNLVNVDWYHPRYAHRHSPEEVRGWCKRLGLSTLWFHPEPSGITVIAGK
jgi:hypothetical protein